MKAYLVLYNLASAAVWAFVLQSVVAAFLSETPPVDAWAQIATPLAVVQSTMVLEILHALLGLVRSPVAVTTMQVASRLQVLWGATYWVSACQAHWSLYLMVPAWSLVEVVRYLFYACNLTMSTIPYPLFWLRYSLFMVLYPMGITGELFQMYLSLDHWAVSNPIWGRVLMLIAVSYIPGSPGMIGNMWGNRKSAFKKRAQAANPRPVSGLVWPVTNPKTNDRSSTKTNQAVWEAALADVDPAASQKVRKCKSWRFGYVPHVEANVRISLASPENAVAVAQAGLDAAHDKFQFVRGNSTMKFSEAMNKIKGSFKTHVIRGEGSGKAATAPELEVPYAGRFGTPYYQSKERRNDTISGPELKKQVQVWADNGVIEQDCADALAACADHPEWMDLSNHYFVLLGAGSAMGPLPLLLSLGANVIAIDLNRPGIWKNLLAKARNSRGTLTFPVTYDPNMTSKTAQDMTDDELAAIAGANLLDQTPEIANWLCEVCPNKKITVGNYTYLDGALHVQLSLACDAIISKLAKARPNLAVAFLCTPTDCHPIPKAAHDAAEAAYNNAPMWQKQSPFTVKNPLKPVETKSGAEIHLVDGVVAAQGPNYILAKRLQHWRAVVERAAGHTVSSNIAPSTATASVVHNAQFAAAYGGMHLFKPMEVMYQETSNAVMGALLIHDINNPKCWANAAFPLANPLQLFEHGSFHGGVWRCGFKINSIGEMSAMAYYVKTYGAAVVAGLAAAVATGAWVVTGQVGFV